jgi:hypothetical protein
MHLRLLDFGFRILDVLLGNRVVFLFLHLVGLGSRVLSRHVIVPSARTGDEFDLEADGFGHGVSFDIWAVILTLARKLAPKGEMSRKALFCGI